MQSEQKHYKAVLIGTENSKKNQLFNALFEISQDQNSSPLTSIQNKSKYFQIEGKGINLEILNTPGSSQYETLRHSCYKGTETLIFVADVTNDESLEFMSSEIELVVQKQLCSYDSSVVLIGINPGGKQRQISLEDFSTICNLIGSYHEVSINEKQKLFDILKSICQERLKFDIEDKDTKSMMQRIHENLQHPLLTALRQKLESNKNNSQKPIQKIQPAAPGSISSGENQVKEINKSVINCLLVGDANVGKSSILTNYADRVFMKAYYPTIGVDFRGMPMIFGNKEYNLRIWDTAGYQKFKAMTQIYYQKANVSFFVYDVTRLESLDRVKILIKQFDAINQNLTKYRCLVANKTDLERNISTEQGMATAQQLGTDFLEISAKNQVDLNNLFKKALQFYHNNNQI